MDDIWEEVDPSPSRCGLYTVDPILFLSVYVSSLSFYLSWKEQ